MSKPTPFEEVVAEMNPHGCLCACHQGVGCNTSCEHCRPPQGGSRADGPLLGTQPRSEAVDALARGCVSAVLPTLCEGDHAGKLWFEALSERVRLLLEGHLPAILAECPGHDDCGEDCPCFERGLEASRE